MKVFFNHIAKCGGTTIRAIAKESYGENFYNLTTSTTQEELQHWLKKDSFFIASEIWGISNWEILKTIIEHQEIKKIAITRNPIEKFQSYVAHSIRDNGDDGKKVTFWGHELAVKKHLRASSWLKACLKYFEMGVMSDNTFSISASLNQLVPFVYSQFYLFTFKSWLDMQTNSLKFIDNPFAHIKIHRQSQLNAHTMINLFKDKYYFSVGTTENIDSFVEDLVQKEVLKRPANIPRLNSTTSIDKICDRRLQIREEEIANYYALLPEEFILNFLAQTCR